MVLSPGTRTSVPTTILFVDDDPALLQSQLLVFEALGYRVLTAGSRETALELLGLNTVNAVVLDYRLPRIGGEEPLRQIRAARADIVIILSLGGINVPPRVLEAVSASVSKGTGPVALLEGLEQQLQSVPGSRPQRKAAGPANFVSI